MNRLKDSTSPYLLQHADNPVDWYPWGEEAFEAARREDKPILLSIGYSACHWCHVMAHESFEDPVTAALINRDFVPIKVDREERPDVDDIYMQATLMFTRGNGGWPMTVFLTPNGKPFHAGTYFPSEDRYGMPSFKKIMDAVVDAYRNRRTDVEKLAQSVADDLQRVDLGIGGDESELNRNLLDKAYRTAIRGVDSTHGGLTRGRPKFPSPMNSAFVLRYGVQTHTQEAIDIVAFALRKMARGGIYDQLGGGFHRYSVDELWLVPHFEKMLYDNAQLSRLYLHTWQATGDDFFKRVATEVYDYILREMTAPGGGFYSATDADSEGVEGKFFVWTPEELKTILTGDEARAAIAYWGFEPGGNFEGHTILNVPFDDAEVARNLGISVEALMALIEAARDKLYAARTHRVHPGLDDKILTAWNGLMLASLAEGARVLGRDDYLQGAIRNAEFLLATMRRADGRLMRSHKEGADGGKTAGNAYLEDYANLIEGLLQLYQATFAPRYFKEALGLAEIVLKRFAASEGGFFDTSDDHEALIARPRALQDNAMPSGNSMTAKVMVLLAAYTGEARYEAAARGVLRPLVAAMGQYPTAFGEVLNAAALLIYGVDEIAIIGNRDETRALLDVIHAAYRPNVILAAAEDDQPPDSEAVMPPLLAGRKRLEGEAAAYVCRKFVCKRPVSKPDALKAVLETV